MKLNKICTFFGHREMEIPDGLCEAIAAEAKRAIEFGCRKFQFLGYGDFDDLCHRIVKDIVKASPERIHIHVRCVLYEKLLQEDRYAEDHESAMFGMNSFESLKQRACIDEHYHHMVEESDYMVFYAEEREDSAAYRAFQHAKQTSDAYMVNLF